MKSENFVTTIDGLPSAKTLEMSAFEESVAPLRSEEIYALANLFIDFQTHVIKEREMIEQGGISEKEEEYWRELYSLEQRIGRIIRRIEEVAFKVLIVVDLAQYNKHIIGSTQRLVQAAAKLKQIREQIRKFIVVVDDVLAIVTKITSGGTFNFVNVFENVTQLLKDLGLELPDLPGIT